MCRSEADRFWEKVDISGTCWEWTAAKMKYGYGRFRSGGSYENGGRIVFAHRWAYEYLRGPIPAGLVLDHLCRNPSCVNPDHLEPVTSGENVLRGSGLAAKNAAKTHCPQGHDYTDENTHRDSLGRRNCRACDREKYHRLALDRKG